MENSYEFQADDIVLHENLFWVVTEGMTEKEQGQLLSIDWCNENKEQILLVCKAENREDDILSSLNFL